MIPAAQTTTASRKMSRTRRFVLGSCAVGLGLVSSAGLACEILFEDFILADSQRLIRTIEKFKTPEEWPEANYDQAVAQRDFKQTDQALVPMIMDMMRANTRVAPDSRPHPYMRKLPGSDGSSFLYTVPASSTYGTASWKHDLVYGAMVAHRAAALVRGRAPSTARELERLVSGSISAVMQNQVGYGNNRGMVGHMNHIRDGKFAATFGSEYTSNITQPPVLSGFIRDLKSGSLDRQILPALYENAQWWLRERMNDGLIFTAHPWELGTDAIVSADVSVLPRWGLKESSLLRQETRNTGFKDPVSKNARFNLAQEILKLGGMEASGPELANLIDHRSPVMSAYVVKHLRDVAAIAQRSGGSNNQAMARELRSAADKLKLEINARQWNETDGFYYSLARRPDSRQVDALVDAGVSRDLLVVNDKGQAPVKVLGAFITLAADIPSLSQAKRMLEVYKQEFKTPYFAPSVSPYGPGFKHNSYWRGSVWINENYWVMRGFMRYAQKAKQAGQPDLAREFYKEAIELAHSSLLLTRQGFYEYYSSKDGRPEGPGGFTWSGLVLNMSQMARSAQRELGAL